MWRRKTGGKLDELEAQQTQMRGQLDGIAAFFASQASRAGPDAGGPLAGIPSGLIATRYGQSVGGDAVKLTLGDEEVIAVVADRGDPAQWWAASSGRVAT